MPYIYPDKTWHDTASYRREYVKRPGVKQRRQDRELQRVYGITLVQKYEMFQEQRGLCGFCGEPMNPEVSKAHVDHDHKTGVIRKLLHKQCNSLVAVFEKRPELIEALKDYLCPSKA